MIQPAKSQFKTNETKSWNYKLEKFYRNVFDTFRRTSLRSVQTNGARSYLDFLLNAESLSDAQLNISSVVMNNDCNHD